MFKLYRNLKYYKLQVIIGPVCKLIEAVFELIVPLVMADIIDNGIKAGDTGYILSKGLLMIGLGAAGLCFALVCQYCGSVASMGVGTRIRHDLFEKISSFSHAELDRIGAPSLITRITNDINNVQWSVAMLIRLVIRAPFLVIGSIVMSMMIDLKLSLIFLIIAPLVSFALYMIMSRSVPFYKAIQRKLERISLVTREGLTGVRVIRAFCGQKDFAGDFEKANNEHAQTAVRSAKITSLLNPMTTVILNLGIAAVIWFGGLRVDAGSLSQGQIIAFANYMTQISLALVVVANLIVTFTKASTSAARINEVMDMHSSIEDGNIAASSTASDGRTAKISFENVSFAYPGSKEYAIEDLNVEIMPGETIGIIGATGSGKSTLINLIPRFYDTNKGRVLVDGTDVRDYELKTLRKKIGIVPQKAVLFSGTIADNLRWRKNDADINEIKKACDIAQASEFVEAMPNGFDSRVLQGGRNFSGGQRQRLAIARALVGRPEILILDDSMSALDYATDSKLRHALRTETEGMTTVIISQRTASIRHCEKIIVLDDARVMAIGRHDELLKDCEVYKEIYEVETR